MSLINIFSIKENDFGDHFIKRILNKQQNVSKLELKLVFYDSQIEEKILKIRQELTQSLQSAQNNNYDKKNISTLKSLNNMFMYESELKRLLTQEIKTISNSTSQILKKVSKEYEKTRDQKLAMEYKELNKINRTALQEKETIDLEWKKLKKSLDCIKIELIPEYAAGVQGMAAHASKDIVPAQRRTRKIILEIDNLTQSMKSIDQNLKNISSYYNQIFEKYYQELEQIIRAK